MIFIYLYRYLQQKVKHRRADTKNINYQSFSKSLPRSNPSGPPRSWRRRPGHWAGTPKILRRSPTNVRCSNFWQITILTSFYKQFISNIGQTRLTRSLEGHPKVTQFKFIILKTQYKP